MQIIQETPAHTVCEGATQGILGPAPRPESVIEPFPKDVASVRKLKFRQCMCEICVNPKLKLTRLSHYMKKKCDSVRELLGESVCAFDVTPKLECVDRKCGHCGVERVRERLGIELRESLN